MFWNMVAAELARTVDSSAISAIIGAAFVTVGRDSAVSATAVASCVLCFLAHDNTFLGIVRGDSFKLV